MTEPTRMLHPLVRRMKVESRYFKEAGVFNSGAFRSRKFDEKFPPRQVSDIKHKQISAFNLVGEFIKF